MSEELLKKIRFAGVELLSLEAKQTPMVFPDKAELAFEVMPEVERETEKEISLRCSVNLGFEEGKGPFIIKIEFRAHYNKREEFKGEDLLAAFAEASYPVLAQASMLIGEITDLMGYNPLIVGPREMLRLAKKIN